MSFRIRLLNFKFSGFRSGFTLIEMLIAIGIIGIVATTTVAIFTRFNRQQSITIANKNVKNDLAEAKSNAISHVVKSCNNAAGKLDGYQIDWLSPTSYQLQEVCRLNSTGVVTPLNPPVKTKTLPSNVTFQNDFGNIRFFILSGGSSGGSIIIRNTADSQSLTISVSPAGVIQ